jgi:hypothetical protein
MAPLSPGRGSRSGRRSTPPVQLLVFTLLFVMTVAPQLLPRFFAVPIDRPGASAWAGRWSPPGSPCACSPSRGGEEEDST